MNQKYHYLFSPMKVGRLEIKNRIWLAPMEGTCMLDSVMGYQFREKVRDFYLERAKDGVGLVIPGMLPVRTMFSGEWLYDHPEAFEPVQKLIEEIHSYGTKVFIQLGIFSGRNYVLSKQMEPLLAPGVEVPGMKITENMVSSDEGVPNVWLPEHKCRALTTEEVGQFVEAYAKCALLCKEAGADGVEIHAVHEGYLMDQFTLPYTNHRTDKYGGSFENRYRFAVETVQAVKRLCGASYPVSMRYSVTSKTIGFNHGAVPGESFEEAGRTMEESEKAIQLLEAAGVDCFNCDNGTYDAWFWSHPPVYMPLNCNLEDVEHIKKHTRVPVLCAGRMQPEDAEQAILEGKLDGVSIGRQFLAEDAFVTKLWEGREEEIRPCISCHSGCFPMTHYKGVGGEVDVKQHEDPRMCALNSRTFAEKKYTPAAAEKKKRFAVVGGGISGMEFALQAAKRGHAVALYEKSGKLGGAFIAAASLSFKEKDRELLAWYERELAKWPVEVHMETEVKDIAGLEADEVVIATGAVPRCLNLPGADRAMTAVEFLTGEKKIGDTIAVIGGGLTGCEVAYELALMGKKPLLVEVTDDLIKAPGVCAANSAMLRELMRYHHVPVYLESSVQEIREREIVIAGKNKEQVLAADSVIASIGYVPAPLAAKTSDGKKIHVIGDASRVGNLRTGIWAADDLALQIC
ncbi:oxidoreductase [Agathobacter sp.]|uniref:oxidoreductase n=1 Tax=Agathobacter sp. TaxID=2021311 RepID=UPI003FD77617